MDSLLSNGNGKKIPHLIDLNRISNNPIQNTKSEINFKFISLMSFPSMIELRRNISI